MNNKEEIKLIDTYELAYNCLRDNKRTNLFKKAILEVVSQNDIVMEVGTGTGILSMFASQKNPKIVYSVEISEYLCNLATRIIKKNKLDLKVKTINENGINKTIIKSKRVDVLIMELMSIGLISEMQVPVFNSLLSKGVIDSKSKIIPAEYTSFLELANINYKMYGYDFRIVQHEQPWFESQVKEILSDKAEYSKVDFNKALATGVAVDPVIDKEIELEIIQTGMINGIVISGLIKLSPGVELDRTQYLNNPIIIPIEDIMVNRGEKIKLHLKYQMGDGVDSLTADIVR